MKRSVRSGGRKLRSDFLRILDERGFIDDCSDYEALDSRFAQKQSVCGYIGFDCTAPSLHVGHLLSIMVLRWMQKCGHQPLVLLGGGTTLIGDPSGRDQTRAILTTDQINANMSSLRDVFTKYISFSGSTPALIRNNADWLVSLNYVDFLRDYGKHFSVNRMIAMESVKTRLEREQSLSFLEFNYMVTQSYDFLELYRRDNCVLQMGGSDQWGNIVSGIDLARRVEGARLYALTTPLLTTADGKKMGKTAAGAVWLKTELLPAYDYWQFWRDCADADVARFLRIFTELPMEEIQRLASLQGAEINHAKEVLATETTALLHGRKTAQAAAAAAAAAFSGQQSGEELPAINIDAAGIGILSACVQLGFAASNGQARRTLEGGGVRINGEVVSDARTQINASTFGSTDSIKLSYGKKKHAIMHFAPE